MAEADGKDPGRGTAGPPAPGREELSQLSSKLTALDARLKVAQEREARTKPGATLSAERGLLGQAWRLSAELVSGLVAGGALGWGLDYWLGTKPWLMLVFFLLGAVAGLNLAVKAAKRMMADPSAETDAAKDEGR